MSRSRASVGFSPARWNGAREMPNFIPLWAMGSPFVRPILPRSGRLGSHRGEARVVEWGAGLVTAPRHDGARVAGAPLASSLAHAAPHPPQGVGARPGESSVARESQARNE